MRRFLAPEDPPPDGGTPEILAIGGVNFSAAAETPAEPRSVMSVPNDGPAPEGGLARDFPELPGSLGEVLEIRTLFANAFDHSPPLLVGSAATKAAFHDLAPGKRYLHLATHGRFEEVDFPEPPAQGALWSPLDPNEAVRSYAPMSLCGLAFAGASHGRDGLSRVPGILTAEELAGIDLSACELAVLSACETSVGLRSAGLGILSLQSALHTAGVRTAVTSLWKVDDEATGRLMVRFYTYLWEEKLSKAEALWKAKCDLREEGRPKRHWAAWVISGSPR